jgi:hypothetical protein
MCSVIVVRGIDQGTDLHWGRFKRFALPLAGLHMRRIILDLV